MRIDVVTIFPEFFDVLDVSLVGKAREKGILDFRRDQSA
jgi:tRNA (guanine37-N1)-methyltransferase